jgi:hypothetical protein
VVPRRARGRPRSTCACRGGARRPGRLAVTAGPDPIDFRFVAEPFEDAPGTSTRCWPPASGRRSCSPRAAAGPRRSGLRGRAPPQRSRAPVEGGAVDADVRARGLDGHALPRRGRRDTPLLEVTLDDAAAYEEDWTGLKGRGGPSRRSAWPCGGRRWRATSCCSSSAERSRTSPRTSPRRARVRGPAIPRAEVRDRGRAAQIVAEARPPVREALRTAGCASPPP